MINVKAIKLKMVDKGLVQKDIAKLLGVSEPTACLKLNGHRELKIDEAIKIQEHLGIPMEEFKTYFFN